MCVGENNKGTIREIHVQDGWDSFDDNECLNGKRCFYLSKTMVTHAGLATIKIPPRLKKCGRLKGAELTVVGLPKKCQNHGKPVLLWRKCLLKKKEVSTSLHSIIIIKYLSYFEVVCWCQCC